MKCAPIIVFAYNRLFHLQKTIEALKNNHLAKESQIYIFSDGSKNELDSNKVESVRSYIKGIDGFLKVDIILRDTNYGLAKSIISGVTEILEKHDSVIVLEDDLVTSPYFLKFMNDSLTLYQDYEKVLSIHGYCYAIKKETPEIFFLYDPGCLGWATWRRSWKIFEENSEKLLNEIIEKGLKEEFDYNNAYPYTKMLKNQIQGKISSWAVRWYASAILNRKLTLYPGHTLVKHIGFDSSATHSRSCDPGQNQPYLYPISVTMIPVEENKLMKQYFSEFLWWWKYPKLLRLKKLLQIP